MVTQHRKAVRDPYTESRGRSTPAHAPTGDAATDSPGKRLAFLRKGRDHAGDPASHDPVGDTRAAHALKERPVGRRVEVLLEVYAASGDQL